MGEQAFKNDLKFDDDDLAANRKGEFSEKQKQRFEKNIIIDGVAFKRGTLGYS